ncbi:MULTISPECIES: hypothetical protein [Streptomyces]|uniref:Secreted protein n=1 Tax=Streptomyces luteosporeus TaxID=173856 RepID=A0ABP6GMD9_9ACTN
MGNLVKFKTTLAALAVAAGGLTLAVSGQGTAQAATAEPAPSCVEGYGWNMMDMYATVHMTNKCTTVQRVRPTYANDALQWGCYELQPGQTVEDKKAVVFPPLYKYTGLVRC